MPKTFSRSEFESQAKALNQDRDIIIHWDSQDIAEDLVRISGAHLPEPRNDYTATILQPIQVRREGRWVTTGWSLFGTTASNPYTISTRFHYIADVDLDMMPVYHAYTEGE